MKGSFVSQVTRDQQIKVGAEFEWPRVTFGNPGYLVYHAEGRERTRWSGT